MIGAVVALMGGTAVSYAAAGAVLAQAPPVPTAVTQQVAAAVATRAVAEMASAGSTTGTLADLAKARAGQAVLLPGVDPRFGAYYVPFTSAGSTVGYVAVATSVDQAPILKIGSGDLLAGAESLKPAVEARAGQASVSHEVRWLDSFTQVADFHFADGGALSAEVGSDRIGYFRADTSRPLPAGSAVAVAHNSWAALSAPSASSPLAALAHAIAPTDVKADPVAQQILAPFPNYEWYRGCAPTAGFMVEAWWSQHGRPNLMATTDYVTANAYTGQGVMATPTPGTKGYIDALAATMNTDGSGNTYLNMIQPGLNSYASGHGYSNTTAEAANPGYSQLVSWINQNHPMVGSFIQWGYYSPTGTFYNSYYNSGQRINHSVALHGFHYDDVHGQFMILRDDATGDGDNYVAWNLAPYQNWSQSQLDAPWY
ncbi:MAG: hypothetical protein ACR2MY_12330 [Candidatus Dormibacteria bacterium]